MSGQALASVVLFTAAAVASAWLIYRALRSAAVLRLANQQLLRDLQAATLRNEALDAQLESRVEARTLELQQAVERLRAEISQREPVEGELLQTRKLESLGVLAGGIAHDFNNFLTVVQANVDLARLYVDPSGPLDEILGQTERACRRAVLLSTQLLTFANGGAPVRRAGPVGQQVVAAVDLARAGATVGISVEVPEHLWWAETDPSQIAQVLHSIVLNAKQASTDGGVIVVRAENVPSEPQGPPGPGALVRISVVDHGSGIDSATLPRIFDPYFTTKATGRGLGLATAYAIVAKHGGHLAARSIPGVKTELVIDLPALPVGERAVPPLATLPSSGTGRLLVMDDEESIRTLLDRMLTKFGYQVQTAANGAEAIDLYQAAREDGRSFDLVLLDLTVSGGMGGVEAAGRLKALDPAAKLVACSGYANAPVMARLRDYGFDAALPKPWAAAELGDVLRRVLSAGSQ